MRFQPTEHRQKIYVCAILAAAILATFWPVTRCDFITFDDPHYVTQNANVLPGLTWHGIGWAFVSGHAANWHPVTWLSHMLDCQLYGVRPWGHHLTNLLLHTANTLLLFLLLENLTRAFQRSAFVAALFALHPLHVESAAWVAERKDVLSTLFGLASLWVYVRYARSSVLSQLQRGAGSTLNYGASGIGDQPPDFGHPLCSKLYSGILPPAGLFYLLALVLFTLSLMSKPMLVTLPFVFLLLDFWPLRRWELPAQGVKSDPLRRLSFLMLEKVPFFALSAASSVTTLLVQKHGGTVVAIDRLPLAGRISNAAVSYIQYVMKTLRPIDLTVFYPLPSARTGGQAAAAALLLLLISVCVILARRRPYLLVGWFWYLGTLVPVIGLVQVGAQAMADRYTYLPIAGLFIALAWGIAEVSAQWPCRRFFLGASAGVLLLACAAISRHQILYWRDTESLFRHALSLDQGNYMAYENLGAFAWQKGKLEEAVEYYQKSLAIRERFEPLSNLGLVFEQQGKWARAGECYRSVLRIRPADLRMRFRLANALAEAGELDDAIAQYKIGLQSNPADLGARNKLGLVLALRGRLDEAIEQFGYVLEADPKDEATRCYLGHALAAQNRFEAAAAQYELALQVRPGDVDVRLGLGQMLAKLGKLEEASAQYIEALRLRPNNPEAHFLLGLVLERQGKSSDAVTHYVEALRLDKNYSPARKHLDALAAEPSHP